MVTTQFEKELTELINRHSLENASDTPDFILARFLQECLDAWNSGISKRSRWYDSKRDNNEAKHN